MTKKTLAHRLMGFLCLLLLFSAVLFFRSLSVQAKADEIVKLNVNETSIAKDGVFRLRLYNVPKNAKVTYRSTDNSVAFVDGRGYITGISNGECIITVTVAANGSVQTLMCNVTVGPAAISIKLTKSEIVLSVGMKKTLKTIISPLNTVEKPVFYASDKTVASVSSIGRVRAKGVGETSIFAFLLNGESAECMVYVLSEEDYAKYSETGTLVGIIEGYSEDGEENTSETGNPEDDGQEQESEDGSKDVTENKTEPTSEPTGDPKIEISPELVMD